MTLRGCGRVRGSGAAYPRMHDWGHCIRDTSREGFREKHPGTLTVMGDCPYGRVPCKRTFEGTVGPWVMDITVFKPHNIQPVNPVNYVICNPPAAGVSQFHQSPLREEPQKIPNKPRLLASQLCSSSVSSTSRCSAKHMTTCRVECLVRTCFGGLKPRTQQSNATANPCTGIQTKNEESGGAGDKRQRSISTYLPSTAAALSRSRDGSPYCLGLRPEVLTPLRISGCSRQSVF
jgi:hypothetical protein